MATARAQALDSTEAAARPKARSAARAVGLRLGMRKGMRVGTKNGKRDGAQEKARLAEQAASRYAYDRFVVGAETAQEAKAVNRPGVGPNVMLVGSAVRQQ